MKSSSVSEDDIRRPRGANRGVQREDVWAAADAVLLAGEKPTIERVRQHLGSGSPNTVGPLLEQWFKHLGRRIQDPGAFAAPAGVPDPVLQAAQHFWETALAQTRGDFDERLRDGLADAVANVESEKERAEIAGAAAFEASTKATKLKAELAEQGAHLQQVHAELAAERARLQEVRAALALEQDRFADERQRAAEDLAETKRQLAAAVERADAADRRVALELDRERNARAKAERQAETLQKAVTAAREAQDNSQEQGRLQLVAANQREEALQTRLALAEAELVARQRLEDLRAIDDAKSAEVTAAAVEVAGLRASLERLTSLIDATGMREPPPRKRSAKPSPRAGSSNS
ncbi:MAG: DNA-binding protein [Hydrogenophaga sp.]|uniref:DNA-binding protein n=1 Tax=Hydrogenophaga sp. TaxID=1904254 RepID=UPI0025B85822|nr:DNA-binding protein [Hydrogenophaga sp.]MBU7572617.1 DNA-binding protein [Hydrogenophaga sp.]